MLNSNNENGVACKDVSKQLLMILTLIIFGYRDCEKLYHVMRPC